jgi:hypothetical protein
LKRSSYLFSLALATNCLGAGPPDFVADVAPGQWRELANTKLEGVFPNHFGHPAWGVIGPRAVTDAWSGGVFDVKRRMLVLTGGGHGDYGGNEVYEFDFSHYKWRRVTEPSKLEDLGDGKYRAVDPEAPVSSHTYDGLVYLPALDAMFKFGGSFYKVGTAYDKRAYLFDLGSKIWKRGAEAPIAVVEVVSDYDPAQERVLVGTGQGLMFYDPRKDIWKAGPQRNSQSYASAGAFDFDRRIFVQIMARTGALGYYNVEDNSGLRIQVSMMKPPEWGKYPGMVYHSPTKQLVIWAGGRDIWAVRTADWAVEKLKNSQGSAPYPLLPNGAPKAAGIYSRWQYFPTNDLFVAYGHAADNVWVYRLPRRGGS